MKLLNVIKKNVSFDGIYCNENCIYKNYEWCNLFNEVTGYNWKKEIAKRITKRIKFFGRE